MKRVMLILVLPMVLSCKGEEKPRMTIDSLQRVLVHEGGIVVQETSLRGDSVHIHVALTRDGVKAWRSAHSALGRTPVLKWATLSTQYLKDGQVIGKRQLRMGQLRDLGPDKPELHIAMPTQAARSRSPRRPPFPEGTEINCKIWAVQFD